MTAIIVAAQSTVARPLAGARSTASRRGRSSPPRRTPGTISSRQPSKRARRLDRRGCGLPGARRRGSRRRSGRSVRSRCLPAGRGSVDLQRVGDVGDGQRREAGEQQRPGPARAASGSGRRRRRPARASGCRRAGRRGWSRPAATCRWCWSATNSKMKAAPRAAVPRAAISPVHPEPPVELAGAGADQQAEAGDGQRVEGEVADVGRRRVGRRGVVRGSRRPVDLARRPRRASPPPIASQARALAAGAAGPDQAGEAGGDHDRVVERSLTAGRARSRRPRASRAG